MLLLLRNKEVVLQLLFLAPIKTIQSVLLAGFQKMTSHYFRLLIKKLTKRNILRRKLYFVVNNLRKF